MRRQMSVEEQKEWLAGVLEEELRRCKGNHRGLAKLIGVRHQTLGGWLSRKSMPDPPSAAKLGAYLGYTNTPWQEFLQGRLDERALNLDRLVNLFDQLPAKQQEEFLTQFQDVLESWIGRHVLPKL